MTDLMKRIAELEQQAANCELSGRLARDSEMRSYNHELAAELRKRAAELRAQVRSYRDR